MEYHEPGYEIDMNTHHSNREIYNVLDDTKKFDKGYNKIRRVFDRVDGNPKRNKVEIYTTGDTGSNIRDAETGTYYKNKVGSSDEHLFFKVILATGECIGKNGSSTLFYLSPNHYMSHMNCNVEPKSIAQWESKRDAIIREKETNKRVTNTYINVN